MRLLLRPEIARQMGIVLLKPGNDLMGVFAQGRVLVEEAPANMAHLPSGRIPDARQPLAEDHLLRPFFTDERVIRAAGGLAALEHWLLLRTDICQYPHASYHHHELVTMRHPPGALAVCWHCDNELRQQTTEQLAELARENVIAWVIDTVLASLGYNRERELSVAELCWWAVSAGIAGAITEEMAQRALRLPSEPEPTVYRESDIVPALPATSILENRLDGYSAEPDWQEQPLGQPLVDVAVEPEAPATFLPALSASAGRTRPSSNGSRSSPACAAVSRRTIPITSLAGGRAVPPPKHTIFSRCRCAAGTTTSCITTGLSLSRNSACSLY